MRTKEGFIVKHVNKEGGIIFSHLLTNELHLIKSILKESINATVEIKETTFIDENDFILQTF